MAARKPKDVPAHYHAITNLTSSWKAYTAGVKAHATRTAAARADSQHEETEREVHSTGTPHSQKGG